MGPQQRRAGTGRLTVVAAAIAVAAALATGPGHAAGMIRVAGPPAPAPAGPASPVAPPPQPSAAPATASPGPSAPAVVPPPRPSASAVPPAPGNSPVPSATGTAAPVPAGPDGGTTPLAFGAFLGSDVRGVARIEGFSRWLGGADVRVGHTYLPGHRWSDIEGAYGFLDGWARWRGADADRMLVVNVPMMERNEEGLSDARVGSLLRYGAAGAFDHHFRVLAERLVALKVPDAVLVLGWEMNGTTYAHRCAPDPEAWKRYWNRIVTTMRSVPGQKFRFDFAPSRGRDAIAWTRCYPGDRTVDIIGMDTYDQPRGMSFDEQVDEPFGLQAHVDFAKAHGKPVSFPEWGLFRNGDNAVYMRRMLEWMDEHKAVYNTLSDYCPHGVWRCAAHPRASWIYRTAHFAPGGRPTAPAPSPPPAGCSAVNLGNWIQQLLGSRLCLRPDRGSGTP
ncbi:glycoside hydrolase family 26 protein [Streptomyces sp. NPDC047725]|uniref:glycoside hydrolase family 26 protein n=1 Tax=Streptomyces sp. NPDC047725 TaxID=3365487 RepID=UPI00371EDEE8